MLDDIDKKILRILQRNAKISVKELSSNIDMSQPAVSERIRKLEKNGFIEKYTIKLNDKKFDQNFICFCFIVLKSSTDQCEKEFRNYVKRTNDIRECYCVAGPYEYIVKIVTKSPETLERVLNEMRKECVVKSYSHPVLSAVKEETDYNL